MSKVCKLEEARSDLVKLLEMEEKLFERMHALQRRGCGENYERKLRLWEKEHLEVRNWARQMLDRAELAASLRTGSRSRSRRSQSGALSFIPYDLFSDYVEMRIIESISTYICDRMLPGLRERLESALSSPSGLPLKDSTGSEADKIGLGSSFGIAS